MRRMINSIMGIGILSILLVGCSSSGLTTETREITNEEIKASMKEVAQEVINEYFEIDLNDDIKRQEQAFENVVVDKKAGTSTHVSNMLRGTTMTEAKEGAIQSYGVVLDKDNQSVQGAIVQIFDSSKPQKYEEATLKSVADQFAITTGVVDNPEKWIYDGIEKAASNKQLSVLRYKNEEVNGYLLVGISLQSGKVVYFEKTVPNK